MYCRNCGQQIDDKAVVCIHCGVAVQEFCTQPAQPTINIVNTNTNMNTNRNVNINSGYVYKRKSKWTAFLLCLLLGYLGVHRFYVGKSGTGLLWLFTFGLGGIGWLFDCILIPFGGLKDKNGQPLA